MENPFINRFLVLYDDTDILGWVFIHLTLTSSLEGKQ